MPCPSAVLFGVLGESPPPPRPLWQPAPSESKVEMENTGNTTVGVNARLYERIAIRLSQYQPFKRLGIRVLDRLCDRCLTSGRCVSDLYKDSWYIPTDELGCPSFCALLAHLESMDESEVATTDLDVISF